MVFFGDRHYNHPDPYLNSMTVLFDDLLLELFVEYCKHVGYEVIHSAV